MAEESEARAERDVTATTNSYGGPVSDQELADVYLPEGQDEVADTGSAPAAGDSEAPPQEAAPDGSGTLDGTSGEPAIEPPD
jgi:hypothetical protein